MKEKSSSHRQQAAKAQTSMHICILLPECFLLAFETQAILSLSNYSV